MNNMQIKYAQVDVNGCYLREVRVEVRVSLLLYSTLSLNVESNFNNLYLGWVGMPSSVTG